MKDVVKTVVSVLVASLIIVICFFVLGNAEYGIELLNTTNLDYVDPTTQILYGKIANNVNFRKADMKISELTSQEIVPYIILNLDEKDYSTRIVEPVKIVCEVTSTIKFTSDDDCKIRIIDNDTIMEYQKKLFDLDNELTFDDFKDYGLDCKNNGEKYYCLTGAYTENVLGYSAFDSAYEYKDKITVVEYYLQINLNDKNRCLEYFNEEYCSNYSKMDKPSLSEEIIKKDGVLYRHVFYKVNNSYFLENSFIVSEG